MMVDLGRLLAGDPSRTRDPHDGFVCARRLILDLLSFQTLVHSFDVGSARRQTNGGKTGRGIEHGMHEESHARTPSPLPSATSKQTGRDILGHTGADPRGGCDANLWTSGFGCQDWYKGGTWFPRVDVCVVPRVTMASSRSVTDDTKSAGDGASFLHPRVGNTCVVGV